MGDCLQMIDLTASSVARTLIIALALTTGGCFLENIDANKDYLYVLKKGSPEKITDWALSRGSAREIGDGIDALNDIMGGALTDLLHHEPNPEKNVQRADAAVTGIMEIMRRLEATADGRGGSAARYDIPAQKAGKIVTFVIEHAAYQAANAEDNIYERKYYTLWVGLEPEKTSRYHELWEGSLENARRHRREVYGE